MKQLLYIACLTTAICCLTVTAAHPQHSRAGVYARQYSRQQLGLRGTPQALLIDTLHQVWVGSTDGLARCNATGCTAWDAVAGLPGNFITDIALAPGGGIYVAGAGGLSAWTGSPQHPFRPLRPTDSLGFVTAILPLGSDTVLAGDLKYPGLREWGAESGRYNNLPLNPDYAILNLARGPDGGLYFAQSERVYILNGGRLDSLRLRPNDKLWLYLYRGAGHTVWCAGHCLYRLEGRRLTDSLPVPESPHGLYGYAFTPDGRIFCGTDVLWEYRNNRWDTVLGKGWFGGFITRIANDGNGALWVACETGLVKVTLRTGIIAVPKAAQYLYTGAGGRLMAGTDSTAPPGGPAAAIAAVTVARYRDGQGQNWYLTTRGIYQEQQGRLRYHPVYLPETGVPMSCNTAIEDGAGHLWFGLEHGLARYDGQRVAPPALPQAEDPYESIYYLAAPPGGGLLAGGYTQVVAVDAAGTGTATLKELLGATCRGIYPDSSGQCLTIIEHTVAHLGYRPGRAPYLYDTLAPLYVAGRLFVPNAIAYDGAGNMWQMSDDYLVVYLRQPQGQPYTPAHTLILTQEDVPGPLEGGPRYALLAGRDGSLIVNRDQQVYRLNPAALIAAAGTTPPPLLSISNVLWNGQPGGTTPTLSDTVRQLNIRCIAYAPANESYLSYEYRLEGNANEWISNGASPDVTFNGLAPGSYRLLLRARDLNNRTGNIVSWSFHILPPWYNTWYARVLWVLLFVAALWYLFTLRVRAVRRRAKVEQLILEEQLKALRAQINPHFLQNTFDFLARSLDRQPVPRIREIIVQLSAYLRNVLYRSNAPTVTLENELEYAIEYLKINQLISPNAFEYSLKVSDDTDTYGTRVPSLLLQPLLENAIKHGGQAIDGQAIRIDIRVYNDADTLYCTIQNSTGRQATEEYAAGYTPRGLSITAQRLMLLYKNATQQPVIEASAGDGYYEVIIRIPATAAAYK